MSYENLAEHSPYSALPEYNFEAFRQQDLQIDVATIDPTMRGSRAADRLYCDECYFDVYSKFKQTYLGEPNQKQLPPIVRDRGGTAVSYDVPMYSGITQDATHLVHIRRSTNTYGLSLPKSAQFFVVTSEFASGDDTEWWVYQYHASKHGSISTELLYLSNEPVHEIDQPKLVDQQMPPFLRRMIEGVAQDAQAQAEQQAILFSVTNGTPQLSWGDRMPSKQFRSFAEIDNDLAAWQLALTKPELTYLPTPHDLFRAQFPSY